MAKPNPEAPTEALCPHCGHVIGSLLSIDGKVCLLVGGIIVDRAIFGKCAGCKNDLDWRYTDEIFERMMKRAGRKEVDGQELTIQKK